MAGFLTDLADILRSAGLTVHENNGWQTRGYKGLTLRATNGIIVHHTAEPVDAKPASMARLLGIGRSDLPGPLSHLYVDRAGEWWVIAAGLANHAGSGYWPGLAGNIDCIGIEVANTGLGEEYPDVQVESWVIGTAALSIAYSVPDDRIIGHKEWAPQRKVDPYPVNMGVFRASVNEERNIMSFTIDEQHALKEIVGVLRWYKQDAHTVGDKLIPFLTQVGGDHLSELAAFATQLIARGSNGAGFADVVIDLVRAGQFTPEQLVALREIANERLQAPTLPYDAIP